MHVWALADLHLSFDGSKPMDLFGPHWAGHPERVEAAWRERVTPDDVVCLPGDLSWALKLDRASAELEWLGRLPGRKVLIKGNHDYWWSSMGKVRGVLPKGVHALQNDALCLGDVAFGGARGWVDRSLSFAELIDPDPGPEGDPEARLHGIRSEAEDARIYRRELGRLETSLRSLDPHAAHRVALLHFPPTSPAMEDTPVTRLVEKYRVDAVVFGHLHGRGWERFENPYGVKAGISYHLVSADFVRFTPVAVPLA